MKSNNRLDKQIPETLLKLGIVDNIKLARDCFYFNEFDLLRLHSLILPDMKKNDTLQSYLLSKVGLDNYIHFLNIFLDKRVTELQ